MGSSLLTVGYWKYVFETPIILCRALRQISNRYVWMNFELWSFYDVVFQFIYGKNKCCYSLRICFPALWSCCIVSRCGCPEWIGFSCTPFILLSSWFVEQTLSFDWLPSDDIYRTSVSVRFRFINTYWAWRDHHSGSRQGCFSCIHQV